MKEDGERAREKADKRNTYLMREGGTFLYRSITDTSHFPRIVRSINPPRSRD